MFWVQSYGLLQQISPGRITQVQSGPTRQERRDQGRRRGGGEVLALARAPLAFRRTLAEVDTRGLVRCFGRARRERGLGWGSSWDV